MAGSAEPTVDVVRIMKEIRESIQRKREQGIYTEEEVDALTELRLRTFGEEILIDPRLVEGLRGTGQGWNIASDYLIKTRRSGPAAFALVALKKMVRPLVRLYTDHIVNRQAQLNLYLAHLLHANIRETARLQVEIQELRHKCRALEAERDAALTHRELMRLGVIVQRYGTEVVGGAELHARWIAQRLAARHEVEVLTTCAVDYLTWENVYPAGATEVAGVRVRRFPVAKRRTAEGFDQLSGKVHFFAHSDRDEQRWMEEHGPVTPALVDHLRKHHADYDALVFFSYRYWTAYHGLQVAPHKSILVPTAEDDPTLGLRMFQSFFALPAAYAFNSPEERDSILKAAGRTDLPGEVVGVGIEGGEPSPVDDMRRKLDLLGDYIVYVGRIEREKGCSRLFANFLQYVQQRSPNLNLVLVGKAVLPIPTHVNITHLGVLSDADKLAAIRGSRLLVHPSPFESLSMALLEGWMMERPALVNGKCAVLRGQVTRANGGLYYATPEEFGEALHWMLGHPAESEAMGRAGRAYFDRNYSWDVILEKYERLLAMARRDRPAA